MDEANGSGNTDTRRAAEDYLRRGVQVIPVPAGEKNPNRPGWQNERWTVEDVPRQWNDGQGVGVLWGEPSGGLGDVDTDWPEASIAARHILPATRTFGRPGARESHRVYRATGTIPKTKRYKIGGGGDDRSVVELLSTGTQSLVPPSLHDSGERREWHREQPAAEIDGEALIEAVADVATAALLARNWPGKGARHEYTLAATGYVGRRLPRERAERVMRAAIAASGDEEAYKRHQDVDDTLDSIEAGHPVTGGPTLDNLAPGVIDQLRRWHGWGSVRQDQQPPTAPGGFRLTDLGNAERLVARHGHNLRYCYPWGKWLVWDGTRWKVDAAGEVARRAVETVRSIYAEAANATDSDEAKGIARHAASSESRTRIEAMVALARSMPGIPVQPEDLDRDPWLLNALNGTVDLRTGELRPHDRGDLLSRLAGAEYDPGAEAPSWEGALTRWLPSEALRRFVQRVCGYALTGDVSEQVLPFLHGPGANGKTTLINTILEMLGDYGQQAAPDLLLAKHGAHPTELADLFGARLAASVEVEDGRRLAESLVKQVTGGDKIKARRMREDFWQFDPTHKVLLVANHKPVVRGTDWAIWRRIKLIPFDTVIPKAEQDTRLPGKLRAELPGILAWAVRGCLDWQRDGLGEPDEVRTATDQYRDESDALSGFIEDCCTVQPGAWCKFKALWGAYNEWRKDSNEQHGLTRQRFADRLTERGFVADRGSGNVAIRRGIALRHDGPDGGEPSKVNSPTPENDASPPEPPRSGGERVKSPGSGPEEVNSRNTCKQKGSVNGINSSYRESGMNSSNSLMGRHTGNSLTGLNELTPEAAPDPVKPLNEPLTPDEVQRYRELVREGMKPEIAQTEVRLKRRRT